MIKNNEGVEYLLTVSNLTNRIGDKEIPIDVVVTASGIGDDDTDYFDNRGGNSSIYKVLSSGTISNNKQLLAGYITKGATGVNGTVTVKAYLDKEKIAISDTYDGTEFDNMGTTNEWAGDRTILTTTEWNNLQTNGVSFQVKVEANEGIWVEEPQEPLPTMDEMCPGCKFLYVAGSQHAVGDTVQQLNSENVQLYDDYHDVITNERKYFLGFKIANDVITNVYLCGIKGESPNAGAPFCLEGVNNNSKYSYNTSILERIWKGGCEDNTYSYSCTGDVGASISSNGTTYVGYCDFISGSIFCE